MSMYDAENLKQKAIQWLKNKYPNSLIIEELPLASLGKTYVDVAAINENEIIGIEIKGDGDSPARLELQGPAYAMSTNHMWLLPSPSLEEKCWKKCPVEWGFLSVKDDKIKIRSKSIKLNYNSPEVIASMLWAEELKNLCENLNIKVNRTDGKKSKPRRHDYISCLVENIPLPKLRKHVCEKLYNRKWQLTEKRIHKGENV